MGHNLYLIMSYCDKNNFKWGINGIEKSAIKADTKKEAIKSFILSMDYNNYINTILLCLCESNNDLIDHDIINTIYILDELKDIDRYRQFYRDNLELIVNIFNSLNNSVYFSCEIIAEF